MIEILANSAYADGVNIENPSSGSLTYWLGVVTEPPGFHLLISLEPAEYEEVLDAANALAALVETPFHFSLLERNYRQLLDSEEFLRIVLGLGREFASPNRRDIASTVISATVNWLTSMRLYLDHEETLVKRTFGKQSEEADRLEHVPRMPMTSMSDTGSAIGSATMCSTAGSQ